MPDKSTQANLIPLYLIPLAILSIVLAGCVPNSAPGVPSPLPAPAETQGFELTPTPVGETALAVPTDAAPEITLAAPPVIQPTVRQELYASDPAQFQMAAGEIQFIEFFAFW